MAIMTASEMWKAFKSRRKRGWKGAVLPDCTLALIAVVLLGWFCAGLVYAGQAGGSSATYRGGEKIFETHCVVCHPGGGNVMNPDKPLKKSNHLKNIESFVSFIRHPQQPMPAFSPEQVSGSDAKELYQYITKVLVPSKQ